LLLGAFSALGPFTIDMYLPSFPEIVAMFNTQASLVQLSLTACLLGLGLGQIVMGTSSALKSLVDLPAEYRSAVSS
jgi:DHA1 family bicyclomycin/chloramphenicol resistance-like MFS transporter